MSERAAGSLQTSPPPSCGGEPTHDRAWPRPRPLWWLFALLLAALAGGCSKNTPALPWQPKQVDQSAAKAQRLKAAKAAAAPALADVEGCESAVMADASLDELSAKVVHARVSVDAFSRSEDAKVLPQFTSAIVLAERDYLEACAVWRSDETTAQARWKRALSKPLSGATDSTDLKDYRHPDLYLPLLNKAAADLGMARAALQDVSP